MELNPFEPNEYVRIYLTKPITKPIAGAIKVLRNAPCFCGSGIKAKRCCLPKLHRHDVKNRSTVV